MSNNDNFEQVLRIAKQLDAIAEGRAYKCPACGEIVIIGSDFDDDIATCECGEIIDLEEEYSLYDYFEETFDIEIRSTLDGEYRSVKLLVAYGGPNIFIDTSDCSVRLCWWGESETAFFDCETSNAIDFIFSELWECRQRRKRGPKMKIYEDVLTAILARPERIPLYKKHWEKCHAENLKSGRYDLIIFSAQMLATIEAAENEMNSTNA